VPSKTFLPTLPVYSRSHDAHNFRNGLISSSCPQAKRELDAGQFCRRRSVWMQHLQLYLQQVSLAQPPPCSRLADVHGLLKAYLIRIGQFNSSLARIVAWNCEAYVNVQRPSLRRPARCHCRLSLAAEAVWRSFPRRTGSDAPDRLGVYCPVSAVKSSGKNSETVYPAQTGLAQIWP